jgi:uncharacterized protein YacL
MMVAVLGIGLEVILSRRAGSAIPSLVMGLLVGFIAAVILVPLVAIPNLLLGTDKSILGVLSVFVIYLCCYLSVLIVYQNRNNFKFVIPFVEFRRERRGRRESVLDTSALIDGRIRDVLATGVLDDAVVIPRFVLLELQAVADSSDRLKRTRGRRGLDIANALFHTPGLTVRIHEDDIPGETVDARLSYLARQLDARLITGDFNLAKLARVEGVSVINLNEVAGALKPAHLPGEQIRVTVIKPGEEEHQGVGYLEDGTMVVVQGGRAMIGRETAVEITSLLQTPSGKMVFGKPRKEA